MPRDGDGIYTRKGRRGYWISYKDADGRRRRRKVEAPNRTAAHDLRSGYVSGEEKAKAHGVRPAGDKTFLEVSAKYLAYQKGRVPKFITGATYEREAGIIEDHLRPFFDGELKAIRKATVARYIAARCASVSAATVTKELNVLKHLLNLAVDLWEVLPASPAHRMKPPKAPPGRLRFLQPAELRAVVEAAPTWLRPIIVLAVATGMRRSEILGLQWHAIDLSGERIMLMATKNGESRIVYLNKLALQAVESLRRPQTKPIDLLFPDVRPEWVSVAFSRTCRGIGIVDFRFHDLRHTAASWLRMQGADIHTVAQVLGHKDLRMTARYSHLSPGFLAEAVGKLDGAFGLNPQYDQELCHQYVTAPKKLLPEVTVASA